MIFLQYRIQDNQDEQEQSRNSRNGKSNDGGAFSNTQSSRSGDQSTSVGKHTESSVGAGNQSSNQSSVSTDSFVQKASFNIRVNTQTQDTQNEQSKNVHTRASSTHSNSNAKTLSNSNTAGTAGQSAHPTGVGRSSNDSGYVSDNESSLGSDSNSQESSSSETETEVTKNESEALVPVLQNITDQVRELEKRKPFKLRDMVKAHFNQKVVKGNPLVSVKDFATQLKENLDGMLQRFLIKK
ncbi:hypothetical protein ACDW34_17300 [Acinetobacter piscicola]|uniref:hypothetical protein n=1 Tax=Acinetobacter piscicola TaxID=2006115 RepID=UPI003558FEC0